jgi:DNA-directed RNA polymerase subunit D
MYAVDRKGPCTVYARDVTPLGDASLAMLEPEVPIVRLGARQALLAYATAVVGSARDHAKWQVAHAVGVWPRVTVRTQKRPGCTPECLERVVRSAPAGMLEIEDGRLRLADENPERAVDLVGLERVCPHGSLQLEIDESRRFLRFETDGSLTARDAFRFAIRDLKRRFEELREAVQALP